MEKAQSYLEADLSKHKQARIKAELQHNSNCYFIIEELGQRLLQTHLPKQRV